LEGREQRIAAASDSNWQVSTSCWDRPKRRVRATSMWKTRIFTVFWRVIAKKLRFSSVFAAFRLRSQKALAIVPSGPDFSVLPRRESVAGLQHVEAHEKNQEDKNTRWQLSQ